MAEPDLIPVFIPALVALLLRAEQGKGSPLSEREVLDIRDRGACVMLPADKVAAMAEGRGYNDIDPEDAWAGWQRARVEIAGG